MSGSVSIGRIFVDNRLVAHALPVGERHWEFSAPRVAVLVLIADPQGKAHIDPGVVAIALGFLNEERAFRPANRSRSRVQCGLPMVLMRYCAGEDASEGLRNERSRDPA